MADKLTETVERLRELLAKATPGPWAYRPQEHDDWGLIRTTLKHESGWHPVVAVARGPFDCDPDAHRRAKTDPAEPNSRLIVEAVNALPDLLAALSRPNVDEMREALKPFALAAEDLDEKHGDHGSLYEAPATLNLTAGHLRTARAVYEASSHE